MTLIPVILSGGSGTRLWPMSVPEKPKQFLPLVTDKTMIQETFLRISSLNISNPIVSCNETQRFLVAQQLEEVTDKKPEIILEPVAKNTAPAIACACMQAMKTDENAVVVILPSDHVILDNDAFIQAVKTAAKEAFDNESLVTFGIVPTFPSTGYGYIKTTPDSKNDCFGLEKFVEKPPLEIAEQYLASGKYCWNSGMFVFKAKVFLSELEKFNSKMFDLSKKSFETAVKDQDFIRLNGEYFSEIKGDSIDYAVMEKTSKGKVVRLDAGWNDVGSWTALWEIQEKDSDNNYSSGNIINVDSKNCYIRSENSTIGVIGLNDVVVVEANGSILISTKDKIQDVKKVFEIAQKMKKN